MVNITLETLSYDELTMLRREIQNAISSYDARKKREAVAAVEAKARELGFSLSEFADTTKSGKAVNPPKYMHPENSEKTWTGRGRQPAWVKDHVDAGRPLANLLIV